MTTKLANYEVVTIAVAIIGGEHEFVHQEDVALKANELAPGKFNWKKYSELIDLSTVRDGLIDARKEKNGSLLTGDTEKGWMLSASGKRFVESIDLSSFINGTETQFRKRSVEKNQEIERARLRSTQAYHLFKEGNFDAITKKELFTFLRINEYFKKNAKQRRLNIVQNSITADSELASVLAFLKDKFPEEFE